LLLFKFLKLRKDVAIDANIKISSITKLTIAQFYGIEYEEFPVRIAEVAMLLINHQMNLLIANEFGQNIDSIPIKQSSTIINGNALKTDWNSLLKNETLYIETTDATLILNEPAVTYQNVHIKTNNLTIIDERKDATKKIQINNYFDYIIGNPPFSGGKIMNAQMRNDVVTVFNNLPGAGVLDYVAAWYMKAAQLIQNTKTKVAFVSTNSIVQGEQVGILWNVLFNLYGIKIHFAHRTFRWRNEAKGNAAVYCVIVGFANYDTTNKIIFDYEDIDGEAIAYPAKNINPYLVDAKDIFIDKKRKPICDVPEIVFGSMPNDGGHLILSNEEKENLELSTPKAIKFIKPLLSAKEFLNNKNRWCFWLKDINFNEYAEIREIYRRIQNVRKYRLDSARPATNKLADFPSLFAEIRQPKVDYILVPRVSSFNRRIIPMGIFDANQIVGDTCLSIPNATLYHFGILQSSMHMAWVKTVCGRLKEDFRYSNEIVYNNFPWPNNITEKQIKKIEELSQFILEIRKSLSLMTLGKMYDFDKTTPELIKAHRELDKAVDAAYRAQAFTSDAKRMEFLFELYEKYTADLFTKVKEKKVKKTN
jgi:hypothetical protein